MQNSSKYDELLIRAGISLAQMNVRDIGLLRDDALLAVECLKDAEIPILGGDVWYRRHGKFELAYANWYADQKPGEDRRTYSYRSWTAAKQYVRDFPKQAGVEPLFVFVVGR
jgi:hypothetical protein